MNKKIMLLALAAVSAAVLGLPGTASALLPLHLNPTPKSVQIDDVGPDPIMSLGNGSTWKCDAIKGNMTLNAGGTTGTISLTLGGNCSFGPFGACTSAGEEAGNIATTTLPFNLVTLPGNKLGVLITTNSGHFATFNCGVIPFELKGNGLVGTITGLNCAETRTEATIVFSTLIHGTQAHTKVAGTETAYDIKRGGVEPFALNATVKLTFSENSQLVCT